MISHLLTLSVSTKFLRYFSLDQSDGSPAPAANMAKHCQK